MFELLAVAPWAAFAILVPLLLRRGPRLDAYPPPSTDGAGPPLVSIIVPARDEAVNIGPCAASLMDSTYPRREIVIVDDESRDGTGEIARALAERSDGRVRVIDGRPVPPGWIGKSWACWQGYQAARGELLLFTDADTRHKPELLGHAVGALTAEDADLVTVYPHQRIESFWERMVMPHMGTVVRLRYANLQRVNRTDDPREVLGNGQFMLLRRDAYEAVGGHRAVRGEIVEDLRLAQRIVGHGRRAFLAHAERLMETRMYRSLAGIVEGWSKNLATGARLTVGARLRTAVPWLIALFLLLFWVAPPALLVGSAFGVGPGAVGWSAAATAFSLVYWTITYLEHDVSALNALLYPLGAAFTAWLFVRSALRGDRVEWKGRSYELEA